MTASRCAFELISTCVSLLRGLDSRGFSCALPLKSLEASRAKGTAQGLGRPQAVAKTNVLQPFSHVPSFLWL